MKNTILFVLFCLFVFSFSGCNSDTVRIKGEVLFTDGAPLKKGSVVFTSNTFSSSSNLNASGNYNIDLPPGSYKVHIALASELDESFVPPAHDPDAVRYIELINPKYASLEKTPLSCEIVKSGKQNFTVELPDTQ